MAIRLCGIQLLSYGEAERIPPTNSSMFERINRILATWILTARAYLNPHGEATALLKIKRECEAIRIFERGPLIHSELHNLRSGVLSSLRLLSNEPFRVLPFQRVHELLSCVEWMVNDHNHISNIRRTLHDVSPFIAHIVALRLEYAQTGSIEHNVSALSKSWDHVRQAVEEHTASPYACLFGLKSSRLGSAIEKFVQTHNSILYPASHACS